MATDHSDDNPPVPDSPSDQGDPAETNVPPVEDPAVGSSRPAACRGAKVRKAGLPTPSGAGRIDHHGPTASAGHPDRTVDRPAESWSRAASNARLAASESVDGNGDGHRTDGGGDGTGDTSGQPDRDAGANGSAPGKDLRPRVPRTVRPPRPSEAPT